MRRPQVDEYPPYAHKYIEKVAEGDLMTQMSNVDIVQFYKNIPEEKWSYAYEEGKWSIKEVLHHLIDSERVFLYRSMRVARNDMTAMAGFEQDDYVENSEANSRTAASLIEEFDITRKACTIFYNSLSEEAWFRKGTASGFVFTPVGGAYMIVGHEKHHRDIIIERYL